MVNLVKPFYGNHKINYMLNKEKLIESIKNMPEDVFEDIDVLLDRIILLEKIENGLKDVKEGNVISEEEMGTIIESWFQK
jgi:hypothetical protein